eukprot:gene6440-11884_t
MLTMTLYRFHFVLLALWLALAVVTEVESVPSGKITASKPRRDDNKNAGAFVYKDSVSNQQSSNLIECIAILPTNGCSGVLIDERWLLTLRECTTEADVVSRQRNERFVSLVPKQTTGTITEVVFVSNDERCILKNGKEANGTICLSLEKQKFEKACGLATGLPVSTKGEENERVIVGLLQNGVKCEKNQRTRRSLDDDYVVGRALSSQDVKWIRKVRSISASPEIMSRQIRGLRRVGPHGKIGRSSTYPRHQMRVLALALIFRLWYSR